MPYRQGVIGYILNNKGELLLIQNNVYKENQWRQPGGGIEKGENEIEAVLREIKEELGISSTNLEVAGVSSILNVYEFPDEVLEYNVAQNRIFRGQQQKQVLLKLKSTPKIISDSKEIRKYAYVPLEKLADYLVFPQQFEKTIKVLEEFRKNGWME